MPFITKSEPFISTMKPVNRPFVCIYVPLIKSRSVSGFTIIELVVTMTVAAILFAIAMPGLRSLITNTRLTTATNGVITDISSARNAATTRHGRVIICSSSNGSSCSGSDWSNGRLMYWEKPPEVPYGTGPLAGVNILRYTEALPSAIQISSLSTYPNPLIFDSSGRPIDVFGSALVATTAMPIVLNLCDADKKVTGRAIAINASGQSNSSPLTCP